MARPAKTEAERRTKAIKFWVSESEFQQIQARAGLVPISTLMRSLIGVEQSVSKIPEVNAQTYADLTRVGNNLNQLQHRLNSERGTMPAGLPERLLAAVYETRNLLDQIRRQLSRRNR